MYKFPFILSLLSLLLLTKILPQDKPIEWGKIPISDLQMTSFPQDSNASAVVLCDYGVSKFNDDLEIEFERFFRVKILNENGYKFGTHVIYLYTGKYGEDLSDLKASTFSLDKNGEIVENELDDDQIFEEEISDGRTKFQFTMPALSPGCIVDIHYKIISESIWFVKDWVFQYDEPVLWSEYKLTYPKNIAYAIVSSGLESWNLNEHNEVDQHFGNIAAAYLGNIVRCHQYRWAVKNAPAIRKEPYMTTAKDYLNRIDVQLAGYSFEAGQIKRVLNDWKTLNNELLDNKLFGDKIDASEVKELTAEITKGLSTPESKLKAIYNWITSSIVWTGEKSVFAYYDVDDVIHYKKGNTADITFLLLSMLKSAGINSDPVILSTRAHGKIIDLYPIVSQFDYVIARVNIGLKNYFIDATDPLRPIDIIPEEILNVKGLIIKKDNLNWVTISTDKNNLDKFIINITLNTDGSVSADFEEQFGEYTSISLRKSAKDKNETDLIKEIYNTESLTFKVDTAIVSRKDSIDLPLRIQAKIYSPNCSQVGGEFIYFNPYLLQKLTDNPFKMKERKFPVDYAYPREQVIVINVSIPDGYELKEKYPDKVMYVGNKISYKRSVEIQDNKIQILTDMRITDSIVMPSLYNQLRDFYTQIINSQSEFLVFGPKEDVSTNENTN